MDREYGERLLATARSEATNESGDLQAVLHSAYDAVIRGDFDALGELVTEDVELTICGFGALDGTWRGRNDVFAATRTNFAEVDRQQPEIESIVSHGNYIAVLLRESGVFRSSGQAYSVRGVQWFTCVDGKISKIDQIIASIWKAAD
jgi:ketosteroid isomerase-like protein